MSISWRQSESSFQASSGVWTVDVYPTRPDKGLVLSKAGSAINAANCGEPIDLLAVTPLPTHSLDADEIYIREHDLIARFRQSSSDDYAFQLNWRLLDAPEPFGLGVELWISVQTRLLDSSPTIKISSGSMAPWKSWTHRELVATDDSQFPLQGTSETIHGNHEAFPAALASAVNGANLLWLIDPSDQHQVHWHSALHDHRQYSHLFSQFLEKGVIRRARFQIFVGPSQVDLSDIQNAYQQLVTSELPLTA